MPYGVATHCHADVNLAHRFRFNTSPALRYRRAAVQAGPMDMVCGAPNSGDGPLSALQKNPLMKFSRRSVLGAGVALATGTAAAQAAWPAGKPTRMIVPFLAGGAMDVSARIVGQAIGDALKTSIVVDNKAGAHGLSVRFVFVKT